MSKADIQERARLLDEIDRLQAALDEANSRFHAMNSPTGREIELQAENKRLLAIIDRLDPPHWKCEHGVKEGDWCEPCNREYKLAAAENEADEKTRQP